MGQNLADVDTFTTSGLERLDDSEDDGMIDSKVVDALHFGGFDTSDDPNHRKSRNEIMKEVMAKSKMHKRERQQQKEFDLDVMEQVDGDLDLMRTLLAPMSEGKAMISSDRLKMMSGMYFF